MQAIEGGTAVSTAHVHVAEWRNRFGGHGGPPSG